MLLQTFMFQVGEPDRALLGAPARLVVGEDPGALNGLRSKPTCLRSLSQIVHVWESSTCWRSIFLILVGVVSAG